MITPTSRSPVTGETKPIHRIKRNAAVDNSSVQSAIDKAKQDAKKNGTAENRIAVTVPITSAARQTSFNVTIKAQTLDLLVKENVRQFTVATDHLVSVISAGYSEAAGYRLRWRGHHSPGR
mgnify:CR=1 FL=1